MKFNCGPSTEVQRRVGAEAATAEVNRIREWHDTFVWWPTRVGEHDCRWLEVIEARYPGARKRVTPKDCTFNDPYATGIRPGRPEYRAKS